MKGSVRVVASVFGALLVGFLLGSSLQPLQSQTAGENTLAPQRQEVLVDRLVSEAEETGRQLRTDVAAMTELMKRIIRDVEIGGWYPDLNDQGRLLGERLGVDIEVAIAQTMLAVAEKAVVRNGQESWVIGRVADFFQVSSSEVKRYHERGYPLSSIILGYGIAKAAKSSTERVFEMRELGQSWPAIATALGVKPQELGKALQGLFP